MHTFIQPFTYRDGRWVIDGYSSFNSVDNERPADALVRAVNFMSDVLGRLVIQVITLPNPTSPEHPHFAFLWGPVTYPQVTYPPMAYPATAYPPMAYPPIAYYPGR